MFQLVRREREERESGEGVLTSSDTIFREIRNKIENAVQYEHEIHCQRLLKGLESEIPSQNFCLTPCPVLHVGCCRP